MVFAGWKPDSSVIYLVNRPAASDSIGDPELPFGLLAYDVNRRKITLLFPDALRVYWANDQDRAVVFYSEQVGDTQVVTMATLWQESTKTSIGKWQIADQSIYQSPINDESGFDRFVPVTVEWSHSNKLIAFSDGAGKVVILNIDGSQDVLTTDLDKQKLFMSWSPDDSHLLVLESKRGWMVTVPPF